MCEGMCSFSSGCAHLVMPLRDKAVECVGLANELEGAAIKAGHDGICCTTGGSGQGLHCMESG